jgi:hypothetical protein
MISIVVRVKSPIRGFCNTLYINHTLGEVMKNKYLILFSLLIVNSAYAKFLVTLISSPTEVNSLAIADGLIAGEFVNNGTVSVLSEFIDFFDNTGGSGNFANDIPFPGGYTDNFTLHASCSLFINSAGMYTFGTNNDDGARLRIDNVDVIIDDTLHATMDFFGQIFLTQGNHELDLVFFEFVSGSSIELFAMQGTTGNSFELIGDVANSGLSCESNDVLFSNGFD